jgi:hypothetical protein
MSSLLVITRVYRLEIQSVMLVFFDPALCMCPSNLLSVSPLPIPLSKVKLQYIEAVCGWEGVGWVLSCVGDHILQEFIHFVSDQIQNLQNCFTTPNKNLGGEGASDR